MSSIKGLRLKRDRRDVTPELLDPTSSEDSDAESEEEIQVIDIETRWNSNIDSLQCYLDNQPIYLQISREKECNMSVEMKAKIQNNQFFQKVHELVKVLTPIASGLGVAQRDKSNLADAVYHWLKIEKDIGTFSIKPQFTKRRFMALTKAALACFTIDPRYRGETLPQGLFGSTCNWICGINAIYLTVIAKLRTKNEHMFPRSYFDERFLKVTEPYVWWESLGCSRFPEGFVKFAATLTRLTCSSAGIERSFKMLKNTMTDNRNRLAVTKAQQLCMIQQFFQQKNSEYEFPEVSD